MSIFTNLFNKSQSNVLGAESAPETPHAISLEKSVINLDKSLVNLSKSVGYDFSALKSRVKLVIDFSGSMRSMYTSGKVQDVITRLLPLALKFDNDGELDCYLFSNGYKKVTPCTKSNYKNFVAKELQETSALYMGGTKYAPVLKAVHSEVITDIPDFIIFITDGDNSDKPETNDIIRKMSKDNCFVIFVGIGNENFDYLSKLDNLSGRPIDNTGFVKCADLERVSDDDLYSYLLSEYASWLKNPKRSRGA